MRGLSCQNGGCAGRAEVGHGSHRKRVWFHAKGRTGIRKKYFSHLWVRAGRSRLPLVSACFAECSLHWIG